MNMLDLLDSRPINLPEKYRNMTTEELEERVREIKAFYPWPSLSKG
jgi:quinolinate synthase